MKRRRTVVIAYLAVMVFFGLLLIASFLLQELVEGLDDLADAALEGIESLIEALPLVGAVELTAPETEGGRSFGLTRSFLVFATFFGGGGYLGINNFGFSVAGSLLPAVFLGLLGGGISFAFFRFLVRQEATSSVPQSAYVGKIGAVTVSLRPGAAGAISVGSTLGTQIINAVADEEIPQGSFVTILSMEGGVARVKRQ